MINKIPAFVAVALILGSASVASAATAHKVAHHHYRAPQGQLMLLRAALCFVVVAPLPPLLLVACYVVVSTEPVSAVKTRLEDQDA